MKSSDARQKVAVYSRVSSQEQAVEGVSIEAQLAVLRDYAKSQGWEVVDEYIDAGYNGGTDERPAFKRLLIDAGQRRFSIIAVCKLDRFFRNLRLLLNHLHGMEQLGIKFVSTQEGLDTSTPYGKFAVQIMGVIAEFERGRIGERVKDSKRYLISGGKWPGGRTMFGYRWMAKERSWEVVPEEAEIVRRIYDLYVNDRIGTESIAAILNKDGLRTRSGAHWHLSNISQVLSHPGYKGRHKIGIPMPVVVDEKTWQLATLEARIAKVKDVLSWGTLIVSEFGIFGEIGNEYIPAGFNAWRECDSKLAIGEITEMDTFHIEGTDKVMRGVDVPPAFWECEDPQKRAESIKKNVRAILQLFDIKVIVFPERVEIKGTIPTQVLEKSIDKGEPATAPINSSPSPLLERGRIFLRRGGFAPS